MKVATLDEIVVVLSVDEVDSFDVVLVLGEVEKISYTIGLLANVVTAPQRLVALVIACSSHAPSLSGLSLGTEAQTQRDVLFFQQVLEVSLCKTDWLRTREIRVLAFQQSSDLIPEIVEEVAISCEARCVYPLDGTSILVHCRHDAASGLSYFSDELMDSIKR